jgi:D-glycero-alpha-D-manno-heptose-7-phosphate kinase
MPDYVKTSAPTRIDFGGSTLDLTPLVPLFPHNIVVNLAISLRAKVFCKRRAKGILLQDVNVNRLKEYENLEKLQKSGDFVLFAEALMHFEIKTGIGIVFRADSPFGAGLGGSSTLLIALLQALQIFKFDEPLGDDELVHEAAVIEQGIIGGPTGKQDYISAVKGGLNAIRFREDAFHIESLPFDDAEFSKRLCIFFTGKEHFSGDNNFSVVNKALSGDRQVLSILKRLEENSNLIYSAIKSMDYPALKDSLVAEMQIRRSLLPSITTPIIDNLSSEAEKMGGALKVCGAGGGGSVFAVFPDGVPDGFIGIAESLGASRLDCGPDEEGLKTISPG